jgi:hypothetical protein
VSARPVVDGFLAKHRYCKKVDYEAVPAPHSDFILAMGRR